MSLGKGLGSLIPPKETQAEVSNEREASQHKNAGTAVLEIKVNEVDVNPSQPRQHINHNELENLVQSIKQHGVLQPIIVTESDGKFELVAGERRLRASTIAGLKTVPAIVRKASDLEKLELALIENIQRSDLNPIEKAEAYEKLISEFGLTQDQAAKKMGISRPSFANAVRLLSLPGEIQKALAEGKISEGHAKVILSLPESREQLKYFNDVVENKLSVRSLESEVDRAKPAKKRRSAYDPQLKDWEDQLQETLNTKVNIAQRGEIGKVTIDFYSPEELNEIVKRITG
ncbi:ParB/RepB/Spo0J family partition protein [Patescibacteria group bacterium]|nr:ParB/RepB/Spo0J family partition protein [Patescibacteria group bacterium]MBU1672981.1 ParB/RepB/Spo0J family partition protein [Patescibacteria group bacterium]MBU1962984.1 ParB/RepB/Spo0J family partition protein [Patescibacteria group bacterium]